MTNVVVLGQSGSYHEEAARAFFDEDIHIVSASSFEQICETLDNNDAISFGLMAIENSIAGTILQNYRILRERGMIVVGEKYLPIRHALISIRGSKLGDIKHVISHPMALQQCQSFLKEIGSPVTHTANDTIDAVTTVAAKQSAEWAAIGSKLAAERYDMSILAQNIESDALNYTRFFVVTNKAQAHYDEKADKASIYLRTDHQKGSLLKVLDRIVDCDINISKLQSYPVPGAFNKYFFHLDLEFADMDQLNRLLPLIGEVTQKLEVLGVYKRDKDQNSLLV